MHYYRNRYYDPSTARFISEDPIGWASGQTNAYAYVNGNPVQLTDPSGLQWAVPVPAGPMPGSGYGPSAPSGVTPLPGPGGVTNWWNKLRDSWSGPTFAKPKPGSKPKGCPAGTKPIDTMGFDKDTLHGIKDGVGAGPRDWTGIAPNGDVITGDSNGGAVNHGDYNDYLP